MRIAQPASAFSFARPRAKPAIAIPMHYGSIVGKADDAQRFKDLLKGKAEVIIKNHE